MKFKYLILCFLIAILSCRQTTFKKENKVVYIKFGYEFVASNLNSTKDDFFMWEEDNLYMISNHKKDTMIIENYELNKLTPLLDSLPEYNYSKEVGSLISKKGNSPWFVYIIYDNNQELKIMSNNLPESFKKYNTLVVKILQDLYNKY